MPFTTFRKRRNRVVGGGGVPQLVLANSMSAHFCDPTLSDHTYRSNGHVFARDRSGNGSDAIVLGPCLTLDGTDDFVTTGLVPPANGTLMAWFSSNVFDSARGVIGASNGDNRTYMAVTAGGAVLIGMGGGASSAGSLSTNTWYHLALTWEAAGSFNAYLDGSRIVGPTATPATLATVDLAIGSIGGSGNYFNGSIVGARIFDRALSHSEVSAAKDGSGYTVGLVRDYALQEGAGLEAFDRSDAQVHGTITGSAAAVWANQQSKFDTLMTDGYRFEGGATIAKRLSSDLAANGSALTNGPGYLAPGQSLDLSGGDSGSAYSIALNAQLADLTYDHGDGNEADTLFARTRAGGDDRVVTFLPPLSGIPKQQIENWAA